MLTMFLFASCVPTLSQAWWGPYGGGYPYYYAPPAAYWNRGYPPPGPYWGYNPNYGPAPAYAAPYMGWEQPMAAPQPPAGPWGRYSLPKDAPVPSDTQKAFDNLDISRQQVRAAAEARRKAFEERVKARRAAMESGDYMWRYPYGPYALPAANDGQPQADANAPAAKVPTAKADAPKTP